MKSYLVVAASVLLLTASCGKKQEAKTKSTRVVKTAVVESRSEIKKDFSGVVEAVEYVKLAFRVSGQIVELPIIEGQKVKKGQLIAQIDPREISLQYTADKAAYETACAQIERNKRLIAKEAISKQDYESCIANYEKSKSNYELSTNNMNDTKLIAPFDGSIEKRYVENFQRVNSGEGIVQLVNTNKLRIKFTLPDTYLYLIKSNKQNFSVEFDTYKGRFFNASIEEYLDISANSSGIPVSIVIDDANFDKSKFDVKPGFTCNINLNSDISEYIPTEMTVVPLSAVFEKAESKQKYVWVLEGNNVKSRAVTVQTPIGTSQALISEGLRSGETVITAGVY